MSKRKNKTSESESWIRSGQIVILAGLTLTAIAVAVNVNDSTILKPVFYYITSVAVAVLLGWGLASGKFPTISYSTGHVLFAFFIVASAISVFNAYNTELFSEDLAFFAAAITVFLGGYVYFTNEEQIAFALRSILLLTAGTVAFAFVQGFFPSLFTYAALSSGREFISTFGNASYFAGFLVLTLPLAAASLFEKRNLRPAAAALAVLCATIVVMLVLTGARSSWVATLISGFVFVILAPRSRYRWYGLIAILGILGIVYLLAPELFRSRLGNLFALDASSSIARRFFFYEGAWKAFLSSPLIGHGLGNFVLFLPRFRAPEYWMTRSEDIVPHAHNEYLEILSETGILGAITFALLLGWIFTVLIRSIRNAKPERRIRITGYLCALIAVLIDNAGSFNLRTYPVAIAFWIITAIAIRDAGAQHHALSIPMWLKHKWVRLIPAGAFVLFLCWYIPHSIDRFHADAAFFAGFEDDVANRNEDAARELSRGLEYSPNDPAMHFYYAVSQMKGGHNSEGIKTANALLANYPWYPKAHLIRAVCKFESGDTAGASADLRAELQLATSPLCYYYASYFAFRNHDTTAEFASLTILLKNALACGIPDNVVSALDRYVKAHHANGNDVACNVMITEIKNKFSADAEVMTEVVECYGILNQQADILSSLDIAMAIPEKKPATARRLEEISAHLKATTPDR